MSLLTCKRLFRTLWYLIPCASHSVFHIKMSKWWMGDETRGRCCLSPLVFWCIAHHYSLSLWTNRVSRKSVFIVEYGRTLSVMRVEWKMRILSLLRKAINLLDGSLYLSRYGKRRPIDISFGTLSSHTPYRRAFLPLKWIVILLQKAYCRCWVEEREKRKGKRVFSSSVREWRSH